MNKVSKKKSICDSAWRGIIARCMSKKPEIANMDPSNEIPKKPLKLVRQVNRLEYDVSWLLDKKTYESIMKRKQNLCASKLCKDVTKQYK